MYNYNHIRKNYCLYAKQNVYYLEEKKGEKNTKKNPQNTELEIYIDPTYD